MRIPNQMKNHNFYQEIDMYEDEDSYFSREPMNKDYLTVSNPTRKPSEDEKPSKGKKPRKLDRQKARDRKRDFE
jgi:hypothetical protein